MLSLHTQHSSHTFATSVIFLFISSVFAVSLTSCAFFNDDSATSGQLAAESTSDAAEQESGQSTEQMLGQASDQQPATQADAIWSQAAGTYCFSSGAGAWSTILTLNDDGTFTGYFHDSDMGVATENYRNGTRYECDFEGKFTDPVQDSEFEYSMQLESLKIISDPGEAIENNTRIIYETASVYGLGAPVDSVEGTFKLYLPGYPTGSLSRTMLGWIYVSRESAETLDNYVIANYTDGNEYAFVGK